LKAPSKPWFATIAKRQRHDPEVDLGDGHLAAFAAAPAPDHLQGRFLEEQSLLVQELRLVYLRGPALSMAQQ
jgi:hypothetical protein